MKYKAEENVLLLLNIKVKFIGVLTLNLIFDLTLEKEVKNQTMAANNY